VIGERGRQDTGGLFDRKEKPPKWSDLRGKWGESNLFGTSAT